MADDRSIAVTSPPPHYDFPVHAPSPTHTMAELTDTMEDPEKELPSEEDAMADEAKAEAAHAKADFPDGGLRAWLVVFGVYLSFAYLFNIVLIFFVLGNVQYIQHVRRAVCQIRTPACVVAVPVDASAVFSVPLPSANRQSSVHYRFARICDRVLRDVA
jgi:hypothetical protein